MNDDLTGANENPSAIGAITKLLVILVMAGAAFLVLILTCRGVGLV